MIANYGGNLRLLETGPHGSIFEVAYPSAGNSRLSDALAHLWRPAPGTRGVRWGRWGRDFLAG